MVLEVLQNLPPHVAVRNLVQELLTLRTKLLDVTEVGFGVVFEGHASVIELILGFRL